MYSNYIFCFDISSIPSVHTTLFAKTLQGDTSVHLLTQYLSQAQYKSTTIYCFVQLVHLTDSILSPVCIGFAEKRASAPTCPKGQPLPRTLSSHFLLISKARHFPCRAFTNYIARNNARYPCRTCVLCVLGLISRSVGAGMLSRCRRY